MNIERVIEDALVTRIKARTYISTNSIPVRRFNDRTTVDGVKCVVVRCRSVERVDPSYKYYRVNLELISKSYLQADMEGDDVTDIYEECLAEINQTMTVAALNTTITDAKISIDGIIPVLGDDEGDEWGLQVAKADIFLTYTP